MGWLKLAQLLWVPNHWGLLRPRFNLGAERIGSGNAFEDGMADEVPVTKAPSANHDLGCLGSSISSLLADSAAA